MLLDTFPTRDAFHDQLASATVVPVGATILADTETPVSVLARFAHDHPDVFLLESAEGGERWGRYSFMGVSARANVAV
ncbi:MAG: anthranilate synthase component I, partial [Lentisphaerae bacterium]|nr:anthranilate synthase component I [Lentisphaerota bacterium]